MSQKFLLLFSLFMLVLNTFSVEDTDEENQNERTGVDGTLDDTGDRKLEKSNSDTHPGIISKPDVNSSTNTNLNDCGRTQKVDSRIVGGKKVDIKQFPWMVSLQKQRNPKKDNFEHFCGGSIINKRWILSAGHCFHSNRLPLKRLKAVVGTSQWNSPDAFGYIFAKIKVHEQFDSFNYANDIALVKTARPIGFKSDDMYHYVNSVCLPSHSTEPPDSARVYGWGLVDEMGEASPDLLKATVNRFDTVKCNQIYEESIGNFTKQMMCYAKEGKDACQGDSGGPLSYTDEGREFQIGIVSLGLGCGRASNPGIYTNVALYEDWIQNIIKNE